jgi:hypothetical protein
MESQSIALPLGYARHFQFFSILLNRKMEIFIYFYFTKILTFFVKKKRIIKETSNFENFLLFTKLVDKFLFLLQSFVNNFI